MHFRHILGTVCLLSLLTAVSVASTTITTPTSTVPTTYQGMSENGVAAWSPWPGVSFGTFRMWDTGTRWNQIETSSGSYSWSKADKIVNLALSNGKDLVYTFGGTPTWASSAPTQTCLYGNGSCAAPRSMSDLSTYAKAVATRYKGKIKYYELWNEPNDQQFYKGTISSMVAMAQTIHDAIKSVDPNAVILSPCATYSSAGSPSTWMNSFLSAGGGSYFDIASYHAYSGSNAPEFIINSVQGMRNALINHGYGNKQLFITEGGWGEDKYLTNDDQRANFVARYVVLAWAKGVSKVVWYAYDNPTWGTLWSSSTGLRPSGTAYNQVYKWLTGATMTGCSQDSNGTWKCTLTRSSGYSGEILWNPSKTTGYNVSSSLTHKVTLSGSLSTVSGGYVTVGPKPILVQN
jgi:Cellulase (glycosyl hydrolase family 5)